MSATERKLRDHPTTILSTAKRNTTRRRVLSILTPYLFLLPALIPYTVFVIYPICASVVLSLYRWDGISATRQFIGLSNFKETLSGDPVFWLSFNNNVKWTILSLILPILLGFLFSLYFGRDLKGFGVYRSVIYFPAILSTAMIAQLFRWIYDPNIGVINQVVQKVMPGQFFDWQANPNNVILYVAIAGSWGYSAFCMLLFINGMRAIPEEIYEAARLDGASRLQAVWHVTIPLLRNTTNVVVTSTIIFSLQVFDYIILLTGGGPGHSTSVLATWAYAQFFNYYSVGNGTAIAVLLALMCIGPAILSQWLAARTNDY